VSEQVKTRKKLIEVALPLDAINVASAREKSIRHGHPSTLHLWWARRPLATARAVLFAQMVDDPSAVPEEFPTQEHQERERQRLFRLIEQLVRWENTTNDEVTSKAREELWRSWRRTCADNRQHARATELFNPDQLPAFHDPFAGGGSIPLEAQRLGLEAYASELNPVAVLINKGMIEIPPRFAGSPPVNPEARKSGTLFARDWKGAQGLADDVRYYGTWMRDEAQKRIGHLYPKIEITHEMARDRPDLEPIVGQQLTAIAWLWAKTVKSPNPAYAQIAVPLVSNFTLSSKPGREAHVEVVKAQDGYQFRVRTGIEGAEEAKSGTKLAHGASFACVMSHTPISGDYIKQQGAASGIGDRLMAVVAEGVRGRVYLSPTGEMEVVARSAQPTWEPDVEISGSTQYIGVRPYGVTTFSGLFTRRQLVALTTFSDLVREAYDRVERDAVTAAPELRSPTSEAGAQHVKDYGTAIATYLAMAVDRSADFWSTAATWSPQPKNEIVGHAFGRQVIPITWDFGEINPFSNSGGNFLKNLEYCTNAIEMLPARGIGHAFMMDAVAFSSTGRLVSTDPPYYDNVPYADISDYFYVWLRRSLRFAYPDLFSTVAVPKQGELVAFAYRHGSKQAANAFFLDGMTRAMYGINVHSHPAFPITIYYAFRQSEAVEGEGTSSTGWAVFLESVIRAGLAVAGTWPIRTERAQGLKTGMNALASSIVLVCRQRAADARQATRREFISALRAELPDALAHLQHGNIAPVDLAQAAIGPGMAIYTRFTAVLDATGKPMTVREALALINQTLDEVLARQEGDFDADTRWAVAWFDELGFNEGEFGRAEVLSKAKNTSLDGLVHAGLLSSRGGKVRLLRPNELQPHWDPGNDAHRTEWEAVHQLVRALDQSEEAAADLIVKLNSQADSVRELAYRLYTICDHKRRASEALAYNALVQSWPEIVRLAQEIGQRQEVQAELL
jgi:putative DNA methylase